MSLDWIHHIPVAYRLTVCATEGCEHEGKEVRVSLHSAGDHLAAMPRTLCTGCMRETKDLPWREGAEA